MRARMIAAVLATACAVTGCTGDGAREAPPTPEGFVRYDGPGYSFAHPADWRPMPRRNAQGEPEVWLAAPQAAPDVPQAEVLVGRQLDVRRYRSEVRRHRFELQLGQYRAASLLTDRRIRVDRPAEVPGAETAHRFEATAPVPARSGRPLRMEVIDLYALAGNGMVVNIAVRAPEGGGDAARLAEVLGSFQIREG